MDAPLPFSAAPKTPQNVLSQTTFEKPANGLSPTEIAWANMRTADNALNLEWFIGGSLGWLRANPGRNYQHLESELRRRDFNTHLIAVKPRLTGATLALPYTKILECDWECIMSCRPVKNAMEELLQHANSYEENWARLAFAGSCMVGDEEREVLANSDGHVKRLSTRAKSNMERLTNNEVIVVTKQITIDQLFADIKEKYPDVQNSVVAMHADGPIVGFVATVDDKVTLVSNVAFVYTQTENGPAVRVILLPDEEPLDLQKNE